jgi:hypothetical protein
MFNMKSESRISRQVSAFFSFILALVVTQVMACQANRAIASPRFKDPNLRAESPQEVSEATIEAVFRMATTLTELVRKKLQRDSHNELLSSGTAKNSSAHLNAKGNGVPPKNGSGNPVQPVIGIRG